jgi:hypothetical protein
MSILLNSGDRAVIPMNAVRPLQRPMNFNESVIRIALTQIRSTAMAFPGIIRVNLSIDPVIHGNMPCRRALSCCSEMKPRTTRWCDECLRTCNPNRTPLCLHLVMQWTCFFTSAFLLVVRLYITKTLRIKISVFAFVWHVRVYALVRKLLTGRVHRPAQIRVAPLECDFDGRIPETG